MRQTTTITFLSSHTDNTDPVYFQPGIETQNVTAILQGGTGTVVNTVSLSGVVAKSRAAGTNSLLQANLGASGAVGQMLINTTHPSRAWAYVSLGSNNFAITQPLVASTVGGTSVPAEVDTWANTDSVQLVTPVQVNIVKLSPTIADGVATADALALYNLTVFDPLGTGNSIFRIDTSAQKVRTQEISSQREVDIAAPTMVGDIFTNCFFLSGGHAFGRVQIVAGAVAQNAAVGLSVSTAQSAVNSSGGDFVADGDFIWGGTGSALGRIHGGGEALLGFVYLDQTLNVDSSNILFNTFGYSGHAVYGNGTATINLRGSSRGVMTGTFTNGFTAAALVSPGIQLNGSTNACSHSGANNPDVVNCAIGTTVAHLDAAQGIAGFGSNAFQLGGASLSTSY